MRVYVYCLVNIVPSLAMYYHGGGVM